MLVSETCIATETFHGFSEVKLTARDIQYRNKNAHIVRVNKALCDRQRGSDSLLEE